MRPSLFARAALVWAALFLFPRGRSKMKQLLAAVLLTATGSAALAQVAPLSKEPPAVAASALAQAAQQPGADPRIADKALKAYQAMLELREAEMRALAQDMNAKLGEAHSADAAHQKTWAEWYQAREKEWHDWLRAYRGE